MSPSVEPFNEAKYKALMDGLEIIEVSYKKLAEIIDYRMESEYFSKKFINNEKLLSDREYKKFDLIATASNGRAYSSEAFSLEGDLYVSKIGDVTNKREIENWEKLSYQEFETLKGALLKDGDILMTLTGDPPDVGKVNIVSTNGQKCTWNQRVARIDRLTNDYISNNVLYAVLSTELCRIQLERFAKGIRQRNLGNECFSFVKLPMLCTELQIILDEAIQKHIDLLDESKALHSEAQKALDEQIGLEGNKIFDFISIKSFKDSFVNTGRLDAEYYQLKYNDILKSLNNKDTVNSLCDIYDANFTPDETAYYQYIELANVGVNGGISNVGKIIGAELPNRARRIIRKGQVIISSIEGSLQSCAYITDEYDGALCSTGFYVLESKYINSETLLVLFKSEAIQALLKQRCSGTILTGISKDEFLSMPLPKIGDDVQKEIAVLVQNSFALREKSKKMLDNAVKAIEIAVEQNEQVAIAWLDEQSK